MNKLNTGQGKKLAAPRGHARHLVSDTIRGVAYRGSPFDTIKPPRGRASAPRAPLSALDLSLSEGKEYTRGCHVF